MHFDLDRLWTLAKEADRDAVNQWHAREWSDILFGDMDVVEHMELIRETKWARFSQIINWRNMLMRQIADHPDNPYSYRAIMSRVITGLSGGENELKA